MVRSRIDRIQAARNTFYEAYLMLTQAVDRLLTPAAGTGRQGFHDLVDGEAGRFLAWRELLEAAQDLCHDGLESVPRVRRVGIPDEFIEHGTPAELHEAIGFTPEALATTARGLREGGDGRIDLAAQRRARGGK